MPIGDLLAQITGEKPSPSSAPIFAPHDTFPKRKAEPQPSNRSSKLPRTDQEPDRSANPTPKPPLDGKPIAQRPLGRSAAAKQQSSTALPKSLHTVASGRVTKQPVNGKTVDTAPPPTREPKKGSYAEILARAQRAQAVMGQVGKIQHKPVAKLDKSSPSLPPTPSFPSQKRRGSQGMAPSSKARDGLGINHAAPPTVKRSSGANGGLNGSAPPRGSKAREQQQQQQPVKKVKKAALATTGYTGTARPKPSSALSKRPGTTTTRAAASLLDPRPRFSRGPRRRDEEDYDEDLEDFIDYDEDDDDGRAGGPRAYDYDSDASSEMEAGVDDIDAEERRAALIAMQEDRREEELERKLKLAKLSKQRKA